MDRNQGMAPVADAHETEQGAHESVLALAKLLFADKTADDTLDAVVSLAKRSIPGCDSASVTVIENGRPRTTVWTDDFARAMDQHQYDNDEGPCLQAIADRSTVLVDELEGESRWPKYAEAAFRDGVRSSLSLALIALDDPLGALNLYSRGPASFSSVAAVGEAFAIQAGITLTNALALHKATELASHLSIALERRDVIGQAKGILIAEQHISSDEAFDILRRASQRANRKLHDIAVEMVERRSTGETSSS